MWYKKQNKTLRLLAETPQRKQSRVQLGSPDAAPQQPQIEDGFTDLSRDLSDIVNSHAWEQHEKQQKEQFDQELASVRQSHVDAEVT